MPTLTSGIMRGHPHIVSQIATLAFPALLVDAVIKRKEVGRWAVVARFAVVEATILLDKCIQPGVNASSSGAVR